ncbi:MAG: hypothetical protein B6A08_19900 [Sorangiineae bacterium NIC37A_2]|nr:MAG: hypothetical protein B6A08_19900 [Sorangiineae bacterium NIC37A_2]
MSAGRARKPAEPAAQTGRGGGLKGGGLKGGGAQLAYETLRDEIINLALPPGQHIDEQALVRRLGLSRTPIRAALVRLTADGLLVGQPNRGVQVAPIDLATVPAYFETLDLTQRAVNRLSARRRTAADLAAVEAADRAFREAAERGDGTGLAEANQLFHSAVAAAAGNLYLAESYQRLLLQGRRLLHIAYGYDEEGGRGEHLRRVNAEHAAIIAALRARDEERCEQLGAAHVELFRGRLVAYLQRPLLREIGVAGDGPR